MFSKAEKIPVSLQLGKERVLKGEGRRSNYTNRVAERLLSLFFRGLSLIFDGDD